MGPRVTRMSAPSTPPRESPPASSRPPRLERRTAPRRPPPASSVLSEATARKEHSDRDMRSKRPPALSLLLRMSTARRLARVVSLLALDFAGVALAIFSALLLKAAVLGSVHVNQTLHETE